MVNRKYLRIIFSPSKNFLLNFYLTDQLSLIWFFDFCLDITSLLNKITYCHVAWGNKQRVKRSLFALDNDIWGTYCEKMNIYSKIENV